MAPKRWIRSTSVNFMAPKIVQSCSTLFIQIRLNKKRSKRACIHGNINLGNLSSTQKHNWLANNKLIKYLEEWPSLWRINNCSMIPLVYLLEKTDHLGLNQIHSMEWLAVWYGVRQAASRLQYPVNVPMLPRIKQQIVMIYFCEVANEIVIDANSYTKIV